MATPRKQEIGFKFNWLNAILAVEPRELTSTDVAVGIGVWKHANRHGKEAWPSIQTIAYAAKVSESTARRSLRRLSKLGWVSIEQGGVGRHHTNRYTLTIPPEYHIIDSDGRRRGYIAINRDLVSTWSRNEQRRRESKRATEFKSAYQASVDERRDVARTESGGVTGARVVGQKRVSRRRKKGVAHDTTS